MCIHKNFNELQFDIFRWLQLKDHQSMGLGFAQICSLIFSDRIFQYSMGKNVVGMGQFSTSIKMLKCQCSIFQPYTLAFFLLLLIFDGAKATLQL